MKGRTEQISLLLKGIAMGAADVVPGVSGGTIAFISGIYEELLGTISSIKPSLLQTLFKQGIRAFWKEINGAFLAPLLCGIAISVLSLAKGISWMLENEPVLLWSFFFGLVLASIFLVGKQVKRWNTASIVAFILGAGFAFWITLLPPLAPSTSMWFLFISGAIAICAMILPGISGSFILLILGSYKVVIDAVKGLEIKEILIFGAGCIVGLLSFSRLLKWLFAKYQNTTIAILTGFLLGSLNKLWPWKENTQLLYTHSDGKQDFLQENISPFSLENAQWSGTIGFFILGIFIIVALEFWSRRNQKAQGLQENA
jgi:putative membrane protein